MSIDKDDIQKKVKRAKRVAARRNRTGGKFRKAGKHWYEIEAYFDEKRREIIGVNESGYMLGVLEDFVIVEVPPNKTPVEINVIGTRLAEMGIKALVIQQGIRFLRLKEISGEQEKKLNDILEHQDNAEYKQKAIDEMIDNWEKRNAEDCESDTVGPKTGSADA